MSIMSLRSLFRYIQKGSIDFDSRAKIIYTKVTKKTEEGKKVFLIKRERSSNEQKKKVKGIRHVVELRENVMMNENKTDIDTHTKRNPSSCSRF